jgi:hypothetical protein
MLLKLWAATKVAFLGIGDRIERLRIENMGCGPASW